jgi:carboxypeptidase Q
MRRRQLLQTLLVAGALPPAFAQGDSPYRAADMAHAQLLRDAALKSGLAYELVSSLVRDVGPRPAGSPGDEKAMQWALARFRSLGFSNVRAEPMTLTAWQRGPASVVLLAPEPQPLVAVALGNSIGTPANGIEAELAYYADFQALRADASDRARGRIVFIDQKTERTRDGSGYGSAVMARFAGAVEAAQHSAIGVSIHSLGTDRDRIAHTGAMRYNPQVAAIPALAVSVPDADRIAELHAAGRTLKLQVRMQAGEKSGLTSHNVIGEVPGTDLEDEVVLIGAHLDTWDISPGALDDGAGCAIVMGAGKALIDGGVKPRRTVRVVLFANEENGFDGARAYAAKYKDVRHQLVGESDFGADRIWRARSKVGAHALAAIAPMAQVLQPLGIPFEGNDGRPGPDAAVIAQANGWPGIELSQDGTRYFDVHHTVNDTLDRIDPSTMPQNVAAWAVVAWLAAQSSLAFGPV